MNSRPRPKVDEDGQVPDGERGAMQRKGKGDVHVGTMAGDVRRVPGSGTVNGDKAIADVMRDVLDRVRRSIRERARHHA
jgi:hypothetical protein